jgi:hypothetical protein
MSATLAAVLDGAPAFTGAFETHITVAPLDAGGLARFEQTCADLAVKCVRIELARGQTRSQPMTGSHDHGTAQDALRRAVTLADQLAERGFRVTRIKIEALPTNADVPITDDDARALSPTNYFEHHVKLLLPADANLAPLAVLCEPHGAHLSANAFKRRDDGQCERFVTVRGHGIGRTTAEARVAVLLGELRAAGYAILKVVAEYCFFDSNEQVDAGWLQA